MKRLAILVFAALAVLTLINAYAAPENTSKPDANSAGRDAPATAHTSMRTRPRPSGWRTISPDAKAKSDAYFEGGYWLILWDFVVGILVAWLLLGTRYLGAGAGLDREAHPFQVGADRALRRSSTWCSPPW